MQFYRIFNRQSFGVRYNDTEQKRFMAAAQESATKSFCERNKTGSVVVGENGIIAGRGHNSPPSGILTCREAEGKCIRNMFKIPSGQEYEKTCQNVHSEVRALLNAGREALKGTLFLFGHSYMCFNCTTSALESGVEDVYIQADLKNPIKHFSREELVKAANKKFLDGLELMKKV